LDEKVYKEDKQTDPGVFRRSERFCRFKSRGLAVGKVDKRPEVEENDCDCFEHVFIFHG
jgi:hypothetical protein